jgi:OOP family OmpA-OmpF porin
MKRVIMLGLVCALLTGPALAQDTGFYIGGAVGQANMDGACEGLPAGVSCDDKDTAWRVFGGYQFNRNFAAELGYANLGEATASGLGVSAAVEVTAWDLVAVGLLPLGSNFSVYGKLGMYSGEAELTSNVGISEEDSGSDITFGVGVRYDFTRNLGVRAEWQRYNDVNDEALDVMSIGVLWRF